MRNGFRLSVLPVLLLTGCTSRSIRSFSSENFDVLVSCYERERAPQGIGRFDAQGRYEDIGSTSGSEDTNDPDGFSGEMEPDISSIRTLPNGGFVVEFSDIPPRPPHKPYSVTCTGNSDSATINSMQIAGRLFRPKAGETWTYATDRWEELKSSQRAAEPSNDQGNVDAEAVPSE